MLAEFKLVLKLRRGDTDALRQAYLDYKDAMFTVARALLNDPDAAQQVLHDAFVSLAAEAPHLGPHRSLRNCLAEQIVNRSAQILEKKMYKVVEVPRTAAAITEAAQPGSAMTAEQHTAAVIDALTQVPLPQREAVTLYHHGCLTLRDVAAVQHVSLNTAETRYRYGIEKLRQVLDRQMQ
jgi:RNA polymerase sigma-70 factor (ECF subfamily)